MGGLGQTPCLRGGGSGGLGHGARFLNVRPTMPASHPSPTCLVLLPTTNSACHLNTHVRMHMPACCTSTPMCACTLHINTHMRMHVPAQHLHAKYENILLLCLAAVASLFYQCMLLHPLIQGTISPRSHPGHRRRLFLF